MAPQKFASVRHKTRPPAARLAPFRDDTGLVALRYEQTKQAEPPIPLPPPRNPRRLTRAPSTFTTSTSSSTVPASPTSPALPASPVIISPPLAPPPAEEHPLFRSQRSSPRSQADEWKRDSGAPTASSITLREEGGADSIYQKLLDDIADTPSVYSADENELHDRSLAPSPLRVWIPPRPKTPDADKAGSSPTVQQSQSQLQSPLPLPSSPSPSPPPSLSPSRHASLTKRFGKGLGFAPDGSKRLRKKKMLGTDRAASQQGPPPETDSPKAPKSPKSPSLAPQPVPGPGPADSRDKANNVNHSSSDRVQPERPLSPATAAATSFAPITTPIPEDSLWDDFGSVSFSKRGSIMFGGKSNPFRSLMMMSSSPSPLAAADATAGASPSHPTPDDHDKQQHATASQSQTHPTDEPVTASAHTAGGEEQPLAAAIQADAPPVPSIRVSSMDVERESQKVRSLYESGDDLNWEDGGRVSYVERLEPTVEVPSEEEENVVSSRLFDPPSASGPTQNDHNHPGAIPTTLPTTLTPRPASSLSPLRDSQVRRDYEPAGGIEDWEDLEGVDVDRYGFITPNRPASRAETADPKSSQFASRRRNVLTKRPSTSYSSSLPGGFIRPPSRKVSARSLNTYTSELSTASRRSARSSIRSAANRLPHNRDRRWMDEAGEMLSLQAGLTGITDDDKMGKLAEAQKRKEAERSEKWRKMATAAKGGKTAAAAAAAAQTLDHIQGQGMDYEFDTKSSKLIERTWKGIPDCWRSAAWYSFLATSARQGGGAEAETETDDYLIGEFRRLQAVASPDDVQIDLDVPRTVSGHIMFRRRYRGGQRLLFRVLHAIALYFPGTGYVQGMASLAATLLCYFDEERAFVMLVRLWRYRGLERLYQPGFAGLMATLEDFEKRWLAGAGKDVAAKLTELCIDATAYGTRWYLTLFNLSIPFPAQLRVWDVFMLLGDCPPEPTMTTSSSSAAPSPPAAAPAADDKQPPQKGLDVLHATSAALIHALRDVLLDSDFENAMKALTAWIPVRDEDLLMKVARAEWRRHQGRVGGGSGVGVGVRIWEWEKEGGRDKHKEREGERKEGRKEEEKEREKRKGEEKRERKAREKEEKERKDGKEAGGRKEKKESAGLERLWRRDKEKDKQQQPQGKEAEMERAEPKEGDGNSNMTRA